MLENRKIKGVNLGGWLLMEGYILGGRNIPESEFKKEFKKIYGQEELKDFERIFRDNFIKEEDFKNISLMGANSIRVPFNFRLIEKKPFVYSQDGLSYIDKVLSWAEKYNLGVILDLHAASGSQNCDWHSDSQGKALLWEDETYQERTYSLWEEIASRFKDSPVLIGYDVLNEPVISNKYINRLKKFYQKVIRRIKAVDKKHSIFIEGNKWAQDIDFLKDLIESNISISIHTYQPLNYTFNFRPFYKFPGAIDGQLWNLRKMFEYLKPYADFSKRQKVKIYVGEFGINWRGGYWGELEWLESMLKVFEEFGFDYTYWTYKAVSQSSFPDGLYQYIPNNNFIRKEGPTLGWENYLLLWKKEKGKIMDFWQTKNCVANEQLIFKLKQFFRNR